MANTDIRIAVSFKGHRKRKRLQRILGFGAEVYLIDLWITVAMDAPEGVLLGWDNEDIADACGWMEDPRKLVDALIESNWLEKDADGNYFLHDWCENQSWACGAKVRSKAAQKAAKARWSGNDDAEGNADLCEPHAEGMRTACGGHAEGNAPYFTLPIHSLPIDTKEQTPSKNHGEESFEKFWTMYGKPVEKKKCLAKWNKLSLKTTTLILEKLPSYILATPDRQFRKNPSTYLNNECWNDEIIKGNNGNGKTQHNYTGKDDRKPILEDRLPDFSKY
jgi:hypothetical protein